MRSCITLIFCFLCLSLSAELPQITPPALQKGDLIAIVFPASYLDNRDDAHETVQRKAKWLETQGYKTILYPPQVRAQGYLAGTDNERARWLMEAWKNPKVKAIWCFRGGYGSCRILDLIDYNYIKSHPKILIGMSDITALHHAIQLKTGLVTFLAPVVNYFDERDDFDSRYAFSELERVLSGKAIAEIPMPYTMEAMKVLRPGKAQGKLIGGNLSLVASLCGTKWQMNSENRILVLEEVGEEIYRIDRMLWQLKAAGLLDKPAAVILGGWKDCKPALKNSQTLDELFDCYFGDKNYPVITGFPTGHGKYQATLPLNAEAEIDTVRMKVKLLESPVLVKKPGS